MKTLVLSFLAVVATFSVYSQVSFECIHQYAGLGIDNVYSVYKSSDGYVWFGGANKAVKYDGSSYTVYNAPSLAFNPGVISMAGDNSGVMYFGTTTGPVWKLQNGTASVFIPAGSSNYPMRALLVDNDGNIWIGTDGAGIFVVNSSASVIEQFNNSSGLPGNNVFDIALHVSGDIYACTNNGVWIHSAGGDSIINTSNSQIVSNSTRGIRFDGNKAWIATTSGLCSYDGTSWETFNISDGLASNFITSLEIDGRGTVWCATMYGGISKVTPAGILSYQTFNSGICYNNVYDIAIDDNGDKWLAMASQNDYSFPVGTCRVSCVAPEIDLQFGTYCYPADITVITNNSGETDALTQYVWDIYNDSNPEAITEDFIGNLGDYGIIPFRFQAVNDYCSSELTDSFTIGYKPEIGVSTSTALTFCSGTDCIATAFVENDTSGVVFNYLWSDGNNNSSTSLAQTGTYSVSVTNAGCTETATVHVNSVSPYDEQQICIISVDPVTNKNVVTWEAASDPAVVSYNIYREVSTNYYQWIANIPSSLPSKYTDMTSEPNVHAEKYKISVVDTCGNESAKSPYHKTINLSAGVGVPSTTVILLWNDYVDESEGLIPPKYYIFRGPSPDNMSVLDSISASFTSYNDLNVDTVYYYAVGIKMPVNCAGTKSISSDFAISNVENNLTGSAGLTGYAKEMVVLPNPATDHIDISFSSVPENLNFIVTDVTGKTIMKKQSAGTRTTFDVSGLGKGLYFITIEGEPGSAVMFVKD